MHNSPVSKLSEGMREGDLADLVLPLMSVDEFQSKVSHDGEAIVIGFYVQDQAAANDFNRFLQKSAAPIIDTDVSPAPDQHGYFMVFIELANNERLAENVSDILAEIKNLVDIDEWQMRVHDLDDLIPFTERNLVLALKKTAKHVAEQAILNYLERSALDSALIEDDLLVIQGSSERMVFEVVGFDHLGQLLKRHKLTEAAISYKFRSIARTNRIMRMLGEGWLVLELDRALLLHNIREARALLVR